MPVPHSDWRRAAAAWARSEAAAHALRAAAVAARAGRRAGRRDRRRRRRRGRRLAAHLGERDESPLGHGEADDARGGVGPLGWHRRPRELLGRQAAVHHHPRPVARDRVVRDPHLAAADVGARALPEARAQRVAVERLHLGGEGADARGRDLDALAAVGAELVLEVRLPRREPRHAPAHVALELAAPAAAALARAVLGLSSRRRGDGAADVDGGGIIAESAIASRSSRDRNLLGSEGAGPRLGGAAAGGGGGGAAACGMRRPAQSSPMSRLASGWRACRLTASSRLGIVAVGSGGGRWIAERRRVRGWPC